MTHFGDRYQGHRIVTGAPDCMHKKINWPPVCPKKMNQFGRPVQKIPHRSGLLNTPPRNPNTPELCIDFPRRFRDVNAAVINALILIAFDDVRVNVNVVPGSSEPEHKMMMQKRQHVHVHYRSTAQAKVAFDLLNLSAKPNPIVIVWLQIHVLYIKHHFTNLPIKSKPKMELTQKAVSQTEISHSSSDLVNQTLPKTCPQDWCNDV